jgi:4'-phosphopantetheinyl transferase
MRVSFHRLEEKPQQDCAVERLAADEVHVWTAIRQTDELWLAPHLALLSADERERAGRFRVEEPRRQYVFARATLRKLLGRYLGTAPNAIEFRYESRGKPFLPSSTAVPPLHFNLSHADRHVAVALSHRRVGIDIESSHRQNDWLSMAEHIFSRNELRELYALPEVHRRKAFFKGWTSKEAYLKATGEGLIDELPTIEVTLTPGTAPRLLTLPGGPQALAQWKIHELPVPEGMAGAVVFEAIPALAS